ncbi:MAG: hypothetical protein A3H97_24000, partial [Acidobacteria bacterium RIFCSPLOWO2_02_FULL_65_29]
ELRRRFCEEELRLNRRLAPQLYDAVVEIRGTPESPRIEGTGPVFEYAVKMREFPQDALASRLLAADRLGPRQIEQLAATIAAFHESATAAETGSAFGSPRTVLAPALQNFEQLLPLLATLEDRAVLAALREWTEREHRTRHALFEKRREGGAVRECHGDLHLGNIVLIDGKLIPFDCIEFNAELRWIDVMSEAAFLVMDLTDRRRPDLAFRFLNAYLELTADYGGLGILRFYLVYRAMVRAKVHCIRASQPGVLSAERTRLFAAGRDYLGLAQHFTRGARAAIVITHGLSGSGKTAISQSVAPHLGAIRIRSDVERKRLCGMGLLARSGSKVETGIYTQELTRATYERLAQLARTVTGAGYPAIVDGAFLRRWQRDLFRDLAGELGVPFAILDVCAPEPVLRARLTQRASSGGDASEADQAVLTHQLSTREPIADDEAREAVRVDSGLSGSDAAAERACHALAQRLGYQAGGQ